MKPTRSSEVRQEDEQQDSLLPADKKHKSSSAAKLTHKLSPHSSAAHSENGDYPADHHSAERRKTPAPLNLTNGEVPSFMRPTKSFEIRDKHNEEAVLQEQQSELERKPPAMKKRAPTVELNADGELPSYMKATKSHEIREQAIATGAVEPDPLEMSLQQSPMIDSIPEPSPTKKKSVGGFLKKKFGLSKGKLLLCTCP